MPEVDFVTGSFFQHGAFGWVSAAWTEPGRIVVRSPVVRGGRHEVEQLPLPVRPDDEARLQQLVSALLATAGGALGAAARGIYVLDLEPPGEARTRLVWSAADEAEALAEARTHIQRIAHLAYQEATLALERGREEARQNDHEQACRTFRAGLDALGDRYAGPDLVDDTEMKLLLAREQERRGDYAAAATIFERILEARLTVYAQREKLPR